MVTIIVTKPQKIINPLNIGFNVLPEQTYIQKAIPSNISVILKFGCLKINPTIIIIGIKYFIMPMMSFPIVLNVITLIGATENNVGLKMGGQDILGVWK